MKVAVIGSRNFSNYDLLYKILDEIQDIKKIISGGAARLIPWHSYGPGRIMLKP